MRTRIFTASKEDFRVDTFSAGGPGGQNQNKRATGVRITHIPTGLSSECRETRSQGTNKGRAFRKLATKLIARLQVKEARPISNETIRTYHGPDNRVKDHASGLQQAYLLVVEGGELDQMIEARRKAKQHG